MIPDTKMPLTADNFGIRFSDLYTYPDDWIDILKITPPVSLTDNFPNPYTGQTTIQILEKR